MLTTIHENARVTTRDTRWVLSRGWRPTPCQLIGGILWLLISAGAWHSTIAGDFGRHAAAIERIKADWLHPANPLLDIPADGSPCFTPYTVALGLLAKATGLAGWQVLKACGPLNAAVVITGVAAFTRTLSARRWAPVLALAAFLLLWGPVHQEWSGFLGLQSMTRGLACPSTLAVGLTFHLWALTSRFAQRGAGSWAYAGLGALTGFVLLVHPFTAMGAVIGMTALVVGRRSRWTGETAGRWALAAAVAFAVGAWWPYFGVFALAAGDPALDAVHARLYDDLWAWYGLALAGLPALVWRLRRNPLDPLVTMFGVSCAVAAYGWFSGHYAYGRIFGLLLVPLQFALAVELADNPPWNRPRRVLVPLTMLTVLATCAGLLAQAGAIVPKRYEPFALERLPHWPSYRWAAERIPAGDVVLTDGYRPAHALPAYGLFLVAPTWPDPSTSAAMRLRRAEAVRAYFASGATAADQRRIARAYRVRWVLTPPGRPAPADAVRVAVSPATGERLYRLPPSPSGA